MTEEPCEPAADPQWDLRQHLRHYVDDLKVV